MRGSTWAASRGAWLWSSENDFSSFPNVAAPSRPGERLRLAAPVASRVDQNSWPAIGDHARPSPLLRTSIPAERAVERAHWPGPFHTTSITTARRCRPSRSWSDSWSIYDRGRAVGPAGGRRGKQASAVSCRPTTHVIRLQVIYPSSISFFARGFSLLLFGTRLLRFVFVLKWLLWLI